jgi:hypothetical protein
MTREMAEQMKGPTGDVARVIAEAAMGEFDRWADLNQDHGDHGKAALYEVRMELDDYLALTLCTVLTEMQLTGQIVIGETDA